MKTTYTYLLLILLAAMGFVKAQPDTLSKNPFMKLYAFGANAGPLMNNETLTAFNLMTMSPENKLLQQNYEAYTLKYNDKSEGYSFGLQTGFIFYNRSKKEYSNKHELRIGLHLQGSQSADLTYEKEERVPFDTLISHTNPEKFYIDTVKTYSYYLKNEQSNFLADLSHIVFIRPQNKIFSVYAGYGIGYGRIFQNNVNARLHYYERFSDQDDNSYDYTVSSNSGYSLSEKTRVPQSAIYQAALNGGLLIRFSNINKNYVRRFAINLDGKAGVRMLQLSNIGLYRQMFINLNFGLKIYLNREVYK